MNVASKAIKTDCAVIGAGFAGASAALELANAGKKVDLFIKGRIIIDCASNLTAGGLAAVSENRIELKEDSFEKHIKDTLKAGKGLNDKKVVKYSIEHFYPDCIAWLAEQGVIFDMKGRTFDLHREGGHSEKRIFHIEDKTGIGIMQILGRKLREHPNIRIHEQHIAIDIITKNKFLKQKGEDACIGVYVYDIANNTVKAVSSDAVFLATGGLGKVFMYTSNPDVATGDGMAMAYRAGIELANMEFVQFHPTVFYDERANVTERRFLFTEALRGEGAILKLHKDDTEDFVLRYHELGSRGTRDIVTRAEDMEMRKHGLPHVWLDCTSIPKERLMKDFKNAYDFCISKGIDISKEPVPVVYAVHYSNGGILVDMNSETSLKNCYALGESSYTGLHGATRLASNSAPECVIFGRRAAQHLISEKKHKQYVVPLWRTGKAKEPKDPATITYYWETIRRTMTTLCGIARHEERLKAAEEVLAAVKKNISELYWNYAVTKDFLEVRNITDVARAIVDSALVRKESRACHYREDYPQEDRRYLGITIIQRDKKPTVYPSARRR